MSSDRTQLHEQDTMVYPLDPPLAVAQEACPHCSASIPVGDQFCPRCGFQRGTWRPPASVQATTQSVSSAVANDAPALYLLTAADGRQFPLPAGEWMLGRGDVPIRVEDGYISRNHAKLTVTADSVTVTDLGSSNGSFVAGNRLAPETPTPAIPGAALSFGQLEFSLERVAQGASDPPVVEAEAAINFPEPPPVEVAEPDWRSAESSPWAIVAQDGASFDLPQGEYTLGRKADKAQHVVDDSYVSGLHAVFTTTETKLTITDQGSTNGTFIGDTRLAPHEAVELHDGVHFRVGQSEFEVHFTETGDAVPADEAATPVETPPDSWPE